MASPFFDGDTSRQTGYFYQDRSPKTGEITLFRSASTCARLYRRSCGARVLPTYSPASPGNPTTVGGNTSKNCGRIAELLVGPFTIYGALFATGFALFPSKKKGDTYMFPGTTGKPYNGWGKHIKELRKNSRTADWTVHDLRRTFATSLASPRRPFTLQNGCSTTSPAPKAE